MMRRGLNWDAVAAFFVPRFAEGGGDMGRLPTAPFE